MGQQTPTLLPDPVVFFSQTWRLQMSLLSVEKCSELWVLGSRFQAALRGIGLTTPRLSNGDRGGRSRAICIFQGTQGGQ